MLNSESLQLDTAIKCYLPDMENDIMDCLIESMSDYLKKHGLNFSIKNNLYIAELKHITTENMIDVMIRLENPVIFHELLPGRKVILPISRSDITSDTY
jgi:hypothetical protein